MFRIDRAVSRRQVPDVAVRGQHLEVRSQVPVDGCRLGGRFYDQQFDVTILSQVRVMSLFHSGDDYEQPESEIPGQVGAVAVPPAPGTNRVRPFLLMAVVLLRVKHEVFHPGVIGFLAGLVE